MSWQYMKYPPVLYLDDVGTYKVQDLCKKKKIPPHQKKKRKTTTPVATSHSQY